MLKIQVFLREDQKTALEAPSARTGVRQSDLVRQGVDLLLEGAAQRPAD
jgi:Ribbon-helix-helix domain